MRGLAADEALHLEAGPGDGPGRDVESGLLDVEGLVGVQHLVLLDDLVELHAQGLGEQGQRRAPDRRVHARGEERALGLIGLAEAEQLDHLGLAPGVVVQDLVDAQAADLAHHAERAHGEAQARVAGVDAGREQGGAAVETGLLQPLVDVRSERTGIDEGRPGDVDHVLARAQDALEIAQDRLAPLLHPVDGVAGRVAYAVGGQRQQRVLVARGAHAQLLQAAQLPDVAALLGFGVHPGADQLQVRVAGDSRHRVHAQLARCPLDDSVRHGTPVVRLVLVRFWGAAEHAVNEGRSAGTRARGGVGTSRGVIRATVLWHHARAGGRGTDRRPARVPGGSWRSKHGRTAARQWVHRRGRGPRDLREAGARQLDRGLRPPDGPGLAEGHPRPGVLRAREGGRLPPLVALRRPDRAAAASRPATSPRSWGSWASRCSWSGARTA